MKTLQEIKKEIEANQEVKRANDAEREKTDNAFISAHKAHTVERGYYLFRRDSDVITATKSDIDRYADRLIKSGYTRI